MSKKNKKYKQKEKSTPPHNTELASKSFFKENNIKRYLLAIAVLAITAIAFYPSLLNDFTNWDDQVYLLNNNDIQRDFTWENIKTVVSSFYSGNFHPLTMMSYFVEHHFVHLEPSVYHINNYILHLLNTLLVFWLIFLISGKTNVAVIVSLFFGIHPLHVESVAWISERKDMLYTFFYLLALIQYIKYTRIKEKTNTSKGSLTPYFLALLFFILSLLSKSAAIVLPIVMLLVDYFIGRTFSKKLLIEKIPFFILSLLFGIIAIQSQQSSRAIASIDTFALHHRFLFASYGIITYLYKLVAPIYLSNYHPYPFLIEGLRLPYIFYIAPAICLLLFVGVYFTYKHTKVIVFGFLFYLINIALVLQFVSVGNAIMAERYTYVSYIGLLFIIGEGFAAMQLNKQKWITSLRPIFMLLLIVGGVAFAYLTRERCKVWKNSETLWTSMIATYPYVHDGYANRVNYYVQQKEYQKALKDVSMAIRIKPELENNYTLRGNIYGTQNKPLLAINDFSKAIEINPNYFDAYLNRAITFSMLKDYPNAFADYKKAIELKPTHLNIYQNRAYYFFETKDYENAIADYNKIVEQRPFDENAFMYRGLSHYHLTHYDEAIIDFSKVIEINNKNSNAYLNRSLSYMAKGNKNNALKDALTAKQLGQTVNDNYISQLQ